MRPTAPFGLKSLAAKIHQPLPLTPRESDKLLSLLTSSFRQQLNKEHPIEPSSSKPQPTDAHISSILLNPLFTRPPLPQSNGRDFVSGTGKAQSLLSNPMEYFREEVAAGEASLRTATMCLDAHFKNVTTYGERQRTESALASSEAATSVLRWLWSSGLQNSMEFIHDHKFVKALLPFLVAENRADNVWRWVKRLQKESLQGSKTTDVTKDDNAVSLGFLLRELVHTRLVLFSDFESGIQDFIRAMVELQVTKKEHIAMVSRKAAGLIASQILEQSSARPDARLIDRMLAVLPATSMGPAAILSLYGSKPDALPALSFIKTRRLDTFRSDKSRLTFVQLCLQTSKALLTQGNEKDGLVVLKLLQDNFPHEIGYKAPSTNDKITRKRRSASWSTPASVVLD